VETVEVQCLSSRGRSDAQAPRPRLTIHTVQRACKAVTLNPPGNPAEHSGVWGGTRTHV